MLRILTAVLFIATLFMAGVLYKQKYETRSLQLSVVRLNQTIAKEQRQIAVLKAEWSLLTQPQRIDKLAAAIGLQPLRAEQIITHRDLLQIPMNKAEPFATLYSDQTDGRQNIPILSNQKTIFSSAEED